MWMVVPRPIFQVSVSLGPSAVPAMCQYSCVSVIEINMNKFDKTFALKNAPPIAKYLRLGAKC